MEQSHSDLADLSSPAKKKRGRPRKLLPTVAESGDGMGGAAALQVSKQRRKRGMKFTRKKRIGMGRRGGIAEGEEEEKERRTEAAAEEEEREAAAASAVKVGQAVRGVVDGSFEAGFLVAVKVGNGESVFHGVVFGPGMPLPISADAAAPSISKATRRRSSEDAPATPLAAAAAPSPSIAAFAASNSPISASASAFSSLFPPASASIDSSPSPTIAPSAYLARPSPLPGYGAPPPSAFRSPPKPQHFASPAAAGIRSNSPSFFHRPNPNLNLHPNPNLNHLPSANPNPSSNSNLDYFPSPLHPQPRGYPAYPYHHFSQPEFGNPPQFAAAAAAAPPLSPHHPG